MALHYHKCVDCLMPFVTETRQSEPCPYCDATATEWMGQVRMDSLVKTEEQTPCDCRCTSAVGPKCVCKCGGKNHGTNMTVEVIKGIRAVPPTPESGTPYERFLVVQKAQAVAKEWKEGYSKTVEALQSKWGQTLEDYQSRRWISDKPTWWAMYNVENMLRKARQARTHKSRMEKLSNVVNVNIERAVN